jgi:hypothetical protein
LDQASQFVDGKGEEGRKGSRHKRWTIRVRCGNVYVLLCSQARNIIY